MIRNSSHAKSGVFATSSMVKIGMLAGLGMILMLLDFPLPIFPTFLKFDLSDAPAVIGAFAMGPAAGVMIEFLKNVLKIIVRSNTGGVGELANFLVGIAYVLPLALIYKKWPNKKGVLWGSLLAVFSGAFFAGVLNYYIFIPAYAAVLGYPVDAFVTMAGKINSAVVDLRTLIVFAIVPFNIIKGIIVAASGFGLFKALRPLWK
ncbi:MAG: ECF transporter S component [Firmicutes bacterium]|nr:ECF transporter S component [Bacillota bacterium]